MIRPTRGFTPRWSALGAALLAPMMFSSPAAGQEAEVYSFVVLMRADTFAVETVSRHADRIEGELAGRTLGRITYVAKLEPGGRARDLAIRAWAPTASTDDPPAQEARIVLDGDTARLEMTAGGQTRRQAFPASGAELVYANPSMALMEQVIRRARARGGDRVDIAIFLTTGQGFPATVSYPAPDSAVIAFAGSEIRAEVSSDGRMLGGVIPGQHLTIVRVAGALPTTFATEPPDYSAPPGAPYRAEDVTVPTLEGHTLAGTLTLPHEGTRFPAVVMITGSGPQERDEAIPMVPGYRPFREIADTLSRRGIAVLRLDDRGTGASTGDFAAATSEDFARDIRAALEFLRRRPDIDTRRLGLVGHSEGGLIAPMIAAADPRIAAIVLIAGPAFTGRRVLEYQTRQGLDRMGGLSREVRDSLFAESMARLESPEGLNAWMRFFIQYDPLPTARRVSTVPVLILNGETDRQVTADQAEVLAAAFREAGNRDVTVRVFPEVNHLMLRDPDGHPGGYMGLEDSSVVPEVRGVLADWLVERFR
jgi:uncharacterized protein